MGEFELRLPAQIGNISLYGFRDDDGDGRPDFGCDSIASDENPIEVGTDDIDGLVIDVSPCFMPDEPVDIDPPGSGRGRGPHPPSMDGGSDDGCGCRAAGPDRSTESALLLLAVLAALGWLRRREEEESTQ
jgi:MYXO-CTERM domain-containing protein